MERIFGQAQLFIFKCSFTDALSWRRANAAWCMKSFCQFMFARFYHTIAQSNSFEGLFSAGK